MVIPSQCRFGGVNQSDVSQFLSDILSQHGVPEHAIEERAQAVLEALGRQPITQAMRSAQPWRDLKAIANHARPRVQLVLPGELSQRIKERAANPQEFGHKKQKKKTPQGEKGTVQVRAEDVGIPDGIFKETSGELLNQIPFASIGPEARGVVVVNFAQAAPYANLARPVSKRGLALVVIDPDVPETQQLGTEIRFPARCEKTSEPVILAARVMQIGNIQVIRNAPAHVAVVEEVDTCVVRFLTYRDEMQEEWSEFIRRPVKQVMAACPELQPAANGTPRVIDCWDRQYLSLRLERQKPTDAEIFVVTFRLEGVDLAALLSKSGCSATYVEPRDVTGKEPSQAFRVIWLTKQDKSSARVAQQSTQTWTSLVRSGNRFGIRVAAGDAEVVHQQHKPHTPFLDAASSIKVFHVGPWPYGATKTTIHKVFQSWGWAARPQQPRMRSATGSGLIWEVHACAAPEYDVWQLSHGDILVSEVQRKVKPPSTPSHGVQGSQRTLAALTVTKQPTNMQADPWEHNDPWTRYQNTTKHQKTSSDSSSSKQQVHTLNVGAIASQIEERVMDQVSKQIAARQPNSDDEMLPATAVGDPKVAELEQRLNQLEVQVQQNAVTQAAQNQAIASKVDGIQNKVDAQSENLRTHMDQRMAEQLAHIEALLTSKKPRHE